MKMSMISVVIPAYNEELSLGSVIDDAKSMLRNMGLPYEIIVVNDGSQDRTADVARKNGVVLINNCRNFGKGAALINGFVKARGDVVVAMDADGSHRADDIPKLVYPILKDGSTKVTIGSRFTCDVGRRSTSSLHLVGNRIINFIILCLTGKYISDSQCGFRAYRKEVFRRIALHSSGFDIESEIIIKLLKNGYDVKEVPIVCYPRMNGLTRIDTFKDGFNIVKAIIKATFYSILG